MDSSKATRQSRSDESDPKKQKKVSSSGVNQSNSRPKGGANTGPGMNGQRRNNGDQSNSNDKGEKPSRAHNHIQSEGVPNELSIINAGVESVGALTSTSNNLVIQYEGSNGTNKQTSGLTTGENNSAMNSRSGIDQSIYQMNGVQPIQLNNIGVVASAHFSNKSDSHLKQNTIGSGSNVNQHKVQGVSQGSVGPNGYAYTQNKINFQNELKKKRKTSDKAQRRASNNKRVTGDEDKRNTGMIPPIEANSSNKQQSLNSNPRSHSRGAAGSTNSQGNVNGVSNQGTSNSNNMNSEGQQLPNGSVNQLYFDSFNPFNYSNNAANNSNFQGSFPFPQNAPGVFMGQQPPQVHFIANKQQFVAQISPEQLMNSDKRPYTAQSSNSLSANTKRAGNVYANAMAQNSTKNSINPSVYNISNNAFPSYPAVYMNGASKTHTSGFNYQPQSGHKFSQSIYGEDQRPKVAGKDIIKVMGASNGFNSGYNSDPYSSVMSQQLPISLTNSQKPAKAKHNRLQAKEKEQLYDETIKMKIMNNQFREENVKLKTKNKILENELNRKEKTIEDLFGQNQMIHHQSMQKQQLSNNQGGFLPIASTTSKYQQETFLVMSLKKQIREFKYETTSKNEELEQLRKNIKNTKTIEQEQELKSYQDECIRLRKIMEEIIKQGNAHPIHNQSILDRINQLQIEIQQKDILIGSLQESLKNKQFHIQNNNFTVQNINNQSNLMSAAEDNSQLHNNMTQQDQSQVHSHGAGTNLRDKSIERNKQAASSQFQTGPGVSAQKDSHKEGQRQKKQLKDKEKEIMKMKNEIILLRKENTEKVKQDFVVNKEQETNVKTLKDRLKDHRQELKRKDEKITEIDSKFKAIDLQIKQYQEQLKTYEESNKMLKVQIKSLKSTKGSELGVKKQGTDTKLEVKDELDTPKVEKKVDEKPKKLQNLSASFTEEALPKLLKQNKKSDQPTEELKLITLIGQREKMSRDDITTMMLAGEESLRLLLKQPSEKLINFIKDNLHDEDIILCAIPKFEMPKVDFEQQVLREMRIVLKDNIEKVQDFQKEELIEWKAFEKFYNELQNFEYPHKDKLLEFIKYFFLDHLVSSDLLMINYQAFKEYLLVKRVIGSEETARNQISIRSARRASEDSNCSVGTPADDPISMKKRLLGVSGEDKHHEEERMLDIAEQCFMRIADLLHMQQKTVKQAFLKYSSPEQFKDGSILELLSPRGFIEGVKESGFDDVTEMEAACLMKVLAKPELDNSVILNEFILIMENFGIPAVSDESEYENDYIAESENEDDKKEEDKEKEEDDKDHENKDLKEGDIKEQKMKEMAKLAKQTKKKNQIVIKFGVLDEKGQKILKKLARFLLQRFMHPREFFGPTIQKEEIGPKKCKVEVIKLHDFYLRLKLASIRKKLKENESINLFLAIDGEKYPGFIQVKRMIKSLEIIAEGEQELIVKEQEDEEEKLKIKVDAMMKERKEKEEPELSEEECRDLIKKEESKQNKKSFLDQGKEPDILYPEKEAPSEAIVKIGKEKGKASPKSSKKEGSKFASSSGPQTATQLNTIEEDMHETQTSHYSYQIKDGEGSERGATSRHQLSTSNQLRNSNIHLNELDNSSRRSVRSGGGTAKALSISAGAQEFSGGSCSSQKEKEKLIQLDINDLNNIQINKFTSKEAQKKDEEIIDGPYDDIDNNPTKDELDAEVTKKWLKQNMELQNDMEDDEDYDEGEFLEGNDYADMDMQMLKEDTIRTEQIEQIVDEDMERLQNDRSLDQGELKHKSQESPIKDMNDDEADEYSFHDEPSDQDQEERDNIKDTQIVKQDDGSKLSESEADYEF